MQRADNNLSPIIKFLTTGALPKSQKQARKILLLQSQYAMFNDMLYHSRVAKAQRTKTLSHYQLVLPAVLINTVLKLYHESPMGGHGGIQDTLNKIKETYYFDKMSVIVGNYVKSCDDCRKRKRTTHKTKATITAFPTPTGPFQVWEVDLYGPLHISLKGNVYVFTAADMFSKFTFAKPLANKDALSVSNALFHLFASFGVCSTLISDQGTEVTAKVTREVCKMLGVEQQFTPSFMHHCLGALERKHAPLAEKLTPFMHSDCKNWEDMLSAIA